VWVYGFKLGLIVSQDGIITKFGLAEARADDRPIADALLATVKDHATWTFSSCMGTAAPWSLLHPDVMKSMPAGGQPGSGR
jgi:hypothetical protein